MLAHIICLCTHAHMLTNKLQRLGQLEVEDGLFSNGYPLSSFSLLVPHPAPPEWGDGRLPWWWSRAVNTAIVIRPPITRPPIARHPLSLNKNNGSELPANRIVVGSISLSHENGEDLLVLPYSRTPFPRVIYWCAIVRSRLRREYMCNRSSQQAKYKEYTNLIGYAIM